MTTMAGLTKAKKFGRFALIWYSEQFAIPFWMVGHVHLHFANYHDFIEYSASFLMHAAVAVGFWLGWKDYDSDG